MPKLNDRQPMKGLSRDNNGTIEIFYHQNVLSKYLLQATKFQQFQFRSLGVPSKKPMVRA